MENNRVEVAGNLVSADFDGPVDVLVSLWELYGDSDVGSAEMLDLHRELSEEVARFTPKGTMNYRPSEHRYRFLALGLRLVQDAMKRIKDRRAVIAASYQAEIERLNAVKSFLALLYKPLQTRQAQQNAVKKDVCTILNREKISVVKRTTCALKGCHNLVFRENLCTEHYGGDEVNEEDNNGTE